MIFANKTTSNL